jgi:hypothetical protein
MKNALTPYLDHRNGELHLDTRKFLEHHCYAVTRENERMVIEEFKRAAREAWGRIETVETEAPMPSANEQ